ncbi:MAG: sporulation membrane protein YtaF [Tissierellaceae bacterium]|nr:sporulation membrane protein YtaF [Tissierellaceae bacterium]
MESLILALSLSLDAFVVSLAYGTNKIKIPFLSVVILNTICSIFLGAAILLGSQIRKIFPQCITSILSFAILFILGVYYLLESIIKSYLKAKLRNNEKVKIKLFDFWFIIDIYVDGTKADLNDSKILDYKEALYLAVALSLDSLAVGFGSSLGGINFVQAIFLSLLIGMASIKIGLGLGKRFAEKINLDLSWLIGVLLMILGVLKLV